MPVTALSASEWGEREMYLDLLKKCLTASIYEESAWQVVEMSKRQAKENVRWSPFAPVRRFLVRQLRKRQFFVVRACPFDAVKRAKGEDWPCFGYTMIGSARLDNIEMCVRDVLENSVPGDFIETGVWRGGSAIFMRAMLRVCGCTDRIVWAADSFEGMPAPQSRSDGWDLSGIELLSVSLEEVQRNFSRFGLLDDQVRFLKGWFCDTLPAAPIDKLAILRLDGDLYHSTMDALNNLYHKVSRGGYVIVDDYLGWPACRNAVHDFLDARSLHPDIRDIDSESVYWRIE